MDKGVQLEILQIEIEKSRLEMQSLWECKLMTDPEVLAASIRLDSLLNQYQLLQMDHHNKIPRP